MKSLTKNLATDYKKSINQTTLDFVVQNIDKIYYSTEPIEQFKQAITLLQEIINTNTDFKNFAFNQLEICKQKEEKLQKQIMETEDKDTFNKLMHSCTKVTEKKESIEILLSDNLYQTIAHRRKISQQFQQKVQASFIQE